MTTATNKLADGRVGETRSGRRNEAAWLLGAMFVVVTLLIFRSGGLQPVVLSDEYTYSMSSRLLPLSAATIPGYLYLAIYRVTNVCGAGYYDCARVLNSLFFIAAAPLVYAVARNVCSRAAASVIALATFTGPISSYTAYFMPEALYFLAFWVFAWQVLRTRDATSTREWAAAGVLLGLAALVKPHAMLCLPSVLAYVICVCRQCEDRWSWRPLACAVALSACAIATKLALGFAFAGDPGLTLFGALYTSIARNSTSGLQHVADLAMLAAGNAWAQIMALAVLFAVPIACAAFTLLAAARSRRALDAPGRIALFAFLLLANLMTVTALFSASTDDAARLHMRYYSFVFPLLLAVVAPPAADEATQWGHGLRVVMTAMLALPVLIAAFTHMQGLKVNLVDCPEITGLLVDDAVFHAACALVIGTLALWAWVPRWGAKAYLFVCLPAFAAIGTFQINAAMRNRLAPDVYDRAGQFTRQYLPNVDIAKVVVVGTDKGEAYRTLFHLDSPSASLQDLGQGRRSRAFAASRRQGMGAGNRRSPARWPRDLSSTGTVSAADVEQPCRRSISNALPGVADVAGLSSAEPWGRWSSADTITLTFVAPLPARFVLHVRGRAYGPNIGADIVARIGGQTAAFELPADIVDREIVLENPQRARTLSISVPHPVAPGDIGMGEDVRRLGVGLVELRISPGDGAMRIYFHHIIKTAGSSFRSYLVDRLGERNVSPPLRNARYREAMRDYAHFAAIAGHVVVDPGDELHKDRLSVVFLRDPIERVLSQFSFTHTTHQYGRNPRSPAVDDVDGWLNMLSEQRRVRSTPSSIASGASGGAIRANLRRCNRRSRRRSARSSNSTSSDSGAFRRVHGHVRAAAGGSPLTRPRVPT